MNAYLLYQDHDFIYRDSRLPSEDIKKQDLGLNIVFDAMANGDDYILNVVEHVMFDHLQEKQAIYYRQDIMKDVVDNQQFMRKLYDIVLEVYANYKKDGFFYYWNYEKSFDQSMNLLRMLIKQLYKIQDLYTNAHITFLSEGLKRLNRILCEEYDRQFLSNIEHVLFGLKQEPATFIKVKIGNGLYGTNYRLQRAINQKKNWFKWLVAPRFELGERDDNGLKDLQKRKIHSYSPIPRIIMIATKELYDFIHKLHFELAFYMGALNLFDALDKKGFNVTYPQVSEENIFEGLINIGLGLFSEDEIVGNDITFFNHNPIFITGSNQGGKSTFLRSVGQAQIMMQAGLFVTAKKYECSIASAIFTHFKKEEDRDMKEGKLSEELLRISNIVDNITTNSWVLFNESFSSTNELEGSEIGKQIIAALIEQGVRVIFVTHFYYLADQFLQQQPYNTLSLTAQITADKQPTYKLALGDPKPTSNAVYLYDKIFKD